MRTTDLFTINGSPMLTPDAEVSFSYEDLDSEDSGRDESGVMHRAVVRYKVGTWGFSFDRITEAERAYLESLFPEDPDFEFGHPDRLDASKQVTCRAYRSKYGISWFDARKGVWRNYSFNIIEC